jgi:hypothetical protein
MLPGYGGEIQTSYSGMGRPASRKRFLVWAPLITVRSILAPASRSCYGLTDPSLGPSHTSQAEDRSFRLQLGEVHYLGGETVYVYAYGHPVAVHVDHDVATAPANHLLCAPGLAFPSGV